MSAEDPKPVLVSACLMGRHCRYDGRTNTDNPLLARLEAEGLQAVPFCPEEEGGLDTPRPPAWIETEGAEAVLEGRARVLTDAGADVTEAFVRGAQLALARCRELGIRKAYLKERSPSCGCLQTHVGSTAVAGPGVTAALLRRAGIETEGAEGRST